MCLGADDIRIALQSLENLCLFVDVHHPITCELVEAFKYCFFFVQAIDGHIFIFKILHAHML